MESTTIIGLVAETGANGLAGRRRHAQVVCNRLLLACRRRRDIRSAGGWQDAAWVRGSGALRPGKTP